MSEDSGQWPTLPAQPVDEQQRSADESERQSVVDHLSASWRKGDLEQDEFRRRVNLAIEAERVDQLEDLVFDILPGEQRLGGLAKVTSAAVQAPLQDQWQSENDETQVSRYVVGESGTSGSVGVLGGTNRVGRWTIAAEHRALTLMGGVQIDLREAVFTNPVTTITCSCVMGGVEIIVPPDMEVQINGMGIMGGFGWEDSVYATPTEQPAPGAPRLVVNGFAFMCGVGLIRLEKGESRQDLDD